MKHALKLAGIAAMLSLGTSAFAQQAAPAAAPPWKQGMVADQEKSTLHPFAPHLTGRPASELPVSKLRVPDGF